ncbi:hypothetical protein NKR23_g6554 [Pleurostoma richardsiae]|uniref:BZIP domain-containing protein n=1 Tax=Pleurostoma richardsiae TaxID=41990 RepID=A0AA38RYM6_9PEZI|nr:hypothetical protein NKR23_g6554 [Pleurostoma richardsiae]
MEIGSSTFSPFSYAGIDADYDYGSATDTPTESPSPASERKSSKATSTTEEDEKKRKRRNRYENASEEVLARRRAQNRQSQRAYRERKEQRIKELEEQLASVNCKNETLSSACEALRAQCASGEVLQFPVEEWVNSEPQDCQFPAYSPVAGIDYAVSPAYAQPESWEQVWDWWQPQSGSGTQ